MPLPRAALAFLLLASCATSPKATPAPTPPTVDASPMGTAASGPEQGPKIVQAQAMLLARPLALPPEVMVPRPTAVPPGASIAPAPGLGGPPPLIVVRPPEPPETPKRTTAPPEPLNKPAPPVVVNPPEASERGPEYAAKRDRPPKPNTVDVADSKWEPKPGQPRYRPCWFLSGGGGAHGADHLPDVWLRCSYRCGRYLVELHNVRGKSGTECEKPEYLKRAEEDARRFDKQLSGKGG
jgi:hypothetical protein